MSSQTLPGGFSNDGFFNTKQQAERYIRFGVLLDVDATAPAASEWVPTLGRRPMAFVISGDFAGSAIIHVRVASSVERPTDADTNYPALAGDHSTPDTIEVNGPYRWVKASVTTPGTGHVRVDAFFG